MEQLRGLDERYLVAVDLGSSVIRLCVGHLSGDDIQVEHFKEAASEGIRGSMIYNPQLVAKVVGSLVRDAEAALMIRVTSVVVGLPRKDVVEITASMKLNRPDPDEYITGEEIEGLKDLALDTYPLPSPGKQEIYGAVAQSFEIDEGLTLRESEVVGTLGSSIEGRFKVFVGRRQATSALDKVFNKLGIAVVRRFFLPEVVPPVILTEVERVGGAAIIDIGAEVTSVSIYQDGALRHFASIPFGGNTVTGDIQTECSLSEELAEKIKKRFGSCLPDRLGELSEKILDVRISDPPMEIPVRFLSEIVDSRYREILEAALYLIQESGLQDSIRGGIVLVGGCAEQNNIVPLLKDISGYRVRKGRVRGPFTPAVGRGILSAANAPVLGMLLAAKDMQVADCVAPLDQEVQEQENGGVESGGIDTSPGEETGNTVPGDPVGQNNVDGESLFRTEEMEEVELDNQKREGYPKGGRKKVDMVKELTAQLSIVWNTIESKALELYDFLNSDE